MNNKGKILIVDDSLTNLRLLSVMLTKQGYKVTGISEGSGTPDVARSALPDLILLDIVMPDISGYEICKQLKADKQTCNIPVIFISALNEVMDKIKAFSVGGVDYITKPFRRQEVLARVETHLALRNTQRRLQEKNIRLEQEIAERIQAQEELRRAKEAAESASRAKSEFLGRMSHEFRTPMNIIIGMTHLTLQTEPTVIQQNYLSRIQSSAHDLLKIINNILDFSGFEAEEQHVRYVNFHLKDILEDISGRYRIEAGKKGIGIRFAIEKDVPPRLIGDPTRLEQILDNLTDNAVKFTEKGEVVLRTALAEDTPDRMKLIFSVKDTGIGIPPEKLSELFAPFTQTDGSTTRKHDGIGLGLSICKRLAKMMRGEMSVESTPGQGSIFSFTAEFGRASESEEFPESFGKADKKSLFGILPESDTEFGPERDRDKEKMFNSLAKTSLTDYTEAADTEKDVSKAEPVLTELAVLLEEGNAESGKCMNAVKECLTGTEVEEQLSSLEDQINNYDFEDAKKTLTEIAKSLNISLKRGDK